jgi:hypothetical protein
LSVESNGKKGKDIMKNAVIHLFLVSFALMVQNSLAGSATWNLNPTSSNWNTAANWTPATVPNGTTDIATFGTSSNTAISLSAAVQVNSIIFNNGANSFSITSIPQRPLTFSGTGIINNSGVTQSFIIDQDDSGSENGITFNQSASAGISTAFAVRGGEYAGVGTGGTILFRDTSTAGSGSFDVFGAAPRAFTGGRIEFWDSSTAGNAAIVIHPGGSVNFANTSTVGKGTITNDNGGLYFLNDATGGDGTITNGASLESGGGVFFDTSSAGNVTVTNNGASGASNSGYTSIQVSAATGTFINNGGNGSGATGGITAFIGGGANGARSTLIANGGTSGGFGGTITFSQSNDGGSARVELFGNGTLDISGHNLAGVTIGSLEGDGLVSLGANPLTIGSSNLSTTFSGLIQGSGSISKIGNGRLILTNANTYSGGTVVFAGILLVNNTSGSGSGTGNLQVLGGTFGGAGIVAGGVNVGTGHGAGAILAPGKSGVKPGTFTIQKKLTVKADATYNVTLDSRVPAADSVSARGIAIHGAKILFNDVGASMLPAGTAFTVINNTTAKPISGTFANLADGSTTTVGSNTFQADYGGGDGNDLTLTVVP